MITRRTILHAGMVQGLAGTFGVALAQSQSPSRNKAAARKKDSADRVPVQSDTRIERVLDPVRDTHHLPGLIGAIFTGNRLTAIGAVGIRKIGAAQPIKATDQVHLGSCTKAMTATMIGTLVDEGKLSWGSTLEKVFPDVAPQLDPEFQKVTLSHLLTHRAGLPHDVSWWHLPGQSTTEQRSSVLTTLLVKPPQNRPGSTYVYSNVGYVLAGLMAEQVTGQSWETLMRRRLFEPLGMTSAGFGSPGRPGTVSEPWGHRVSGGQVRPTQQDNAPAMGPAGTVHCSIPDWGKFAALHLAGARSGEAVESLHFQSTPDSSSRIRICRRLARRRAHLGGRSRAEPQREQHLLVRHRLAGAGPEPRLPGRHQPGRQARRDRHRRGRRRADPGGRAPRIEPHARSARVEEPPSFRSTRLAGSRRPA